MREVPRGWIGWYPAAGSETEEEEEAVIARTSSTRGLSRFSRTRACSRGVCSDRGVLKRRLRYSYWKKSSFWGLSLMPPRVNLKVSCGGC